MQRLYPPPAVSLEVGAVYADLAWPGPPPHRPHVAVNMIASADGRAAAGGGTDLLASRVDRALMRALRAHADALLHGAGTLRAETFGAGVPVELAAWRAARGLTPQPLAIVVSASGAVPAHDRYLGTDPRRRLIVTSAAGARQLSEAVRGRAELLVAGEEAVDLLAALRTLRVERGVRWLLCEGGPRLAHALFASGAVDELFLTLAPKLVAGPGPAVLDGASLHPPLPLTLLAVHEHAGELFLRYRVDAGPR